ncbi:MAG: DNA sulfur modification protein DndD [Cenarchaeum symbiont of Oopsacas minuta]|nr:DNA sulfur modification protein DndD [Cenarchaeum symbiont of Oopsacas minuta]
MLFEKLTIKNYGVYAEKTDFNFSTTPKKPIILIGGLNGAGKTTIFESIMIALYGKIYLGRKTTKKEYSAFIVNRIHRHDGKRAKHASIELSFRFHHNGSEDSYMIHRSWVVEGMSISESLQLQKNGKLLTDVNESLWQSFIEGLIPFGISKLFFFDGEKIVSMTKWNEQDNAELRSSIEILLGAELIHRLQSDLDLYMIRKSDKNNKNELIQNEYKKLQNEKESLLSDLDSLDAERQKKLQEIEESMSDVTSKELKIVGVGGGYANIRNELLTEKTILEEKTAYKIKEIQEELAGDAPLYLVSNILSQILQQMEKDANIVRQNISATTIQKNVEKIKKEIISEEFWPNGIIINKVVTKMIRRLDSLIKKPSDDVFFDISPKDMSWTHQKILKIKEGHKTLSKKLDEYTKADMKLGKIESDLSKIPRDDEIGPKISDINNIYQEIGILKSDISHINQQIASKKAYQKMLQTKLKGVIDIIYKNKTVDIGINLASGMQKVLNTYYFNLLERKMTELESHLLEIIKILLHKNFISKINIDRKTFKIEIYGNDMELISGNLLAMGERQIFGTAMLWAIAKTCGRALPFVIDTPLGRLDGEHLTNLTEKFYPFASHQLILLSTDREIGHKEYDQLSKYISHSYRITCDRAKSITTMHEGYFMGGKIAQT